MAKGICNGPPQVQTLGYTSVNIFKFQPATIGVLRSAITSHCDYIKPIPLEISFSIYSIELLLPGSWLPRN